MPGTRARPTVPCCRWLARPDTELEQAHRADALFDAHRADPEFGHRLLADEARDAGQPMAYRTLWRICWANGWWSAFGKPKRGKAGRPGPPVHDDLCAVTDERGRVRHGFSADGPNQLWPADITEHRTAEGKLCLCAVKDAFPNRIVGYSIDSRMKSRIAVAALGSAVARRQVEGLQVAGCILHTDRGSQGGFNWSSQHPVIMEVFDGSSSAGSGPRGAAEALHRHGMVGSMGRVGAAGDNAAMESVFALLQNNVLDLRSWSTRKELRTAIVTWIERTYHHRRRQDRLGRLTPIEYETIMTNPALQAA